MKMFALLTGAWESKDTEFGDRRILLVRLFQFFGKNVFPSRCDDQFLDPSGEKQVAV